LNLTLSQERINPVNKKDVVITLPSKKPFKNVYQLKVTLLETDPPIWRRIQVPEYYTFYDLHVAIQNAMGWTDSHLHEFEIADETRKRGIRCIECPYCTEDIEEEDFLLTTEVPLKDYLNKAGNGVLYRYDFGDSWEHDVLLEGIFKREPNIKYPRCLDGELACPAEDCGGIPGYYDCIEAVKKRDNRNGLLTWLDGWKPDRFNTKDVKFENPRTRLKDTLKD